MSHVADEAEEFVSKSFQTDAAFDALVDAVFPPYAKAAGVNSAIEKRYPPVLNGAGPYKTERDRAKAVVRDLVFLCNVRSLSDAYRGRNWNLQYSVPPGLHGSDVLPTFFNRNVNLTLIDEIAGAPISPEFISLIETYQSYFVSQARTGNPNTLKRPRAITWPRPYNKGDVIGGVLDFSDRGFNVITDNQASESVCRFWRHVEATVTDRGGMNPVFLLPDRSPYSFLSGGGAERPRV